MQDVTAYTFDGSFVAAEKRSIGLVLEASNVDPVLLASGVDRLLQGSPLEPPSPPYACLS